MIGLFILWTLLIRTIDVQPIGADGTDIGFARLNTWFHRFTGVHMRIYTITDWLGLVPIAICMMFGGLGLVQLIRRRSFLKVDSDLLLLGGYYMLVIAGYLIFEMIPINYRPIRIESCLEASYPSSTTLLVLSVMPTLSFQLHRRVRCTAIRKTADGLNLFFSLFMVVGRTVSGVHWLTDIMGAVILSTGLYLMYHGSVVWTEKKQRNELR